VADIVEGGGNYEDTVAPPGADPFGEALASVEQASQETTVRGENILFQLHSTPTWYFFIALL